MENTRGLLRRRNYFVQKDFQSRFIVRFSLLVLLGACLSAVLLVFLSQDTLTSSFQQSRLSIEKTGLAILPSIIYINLATLAIIITATVAVTLFISHKLAGPLFRFQKELRQVGKGDLTGKITLRKRDQIGALAESLNETIGALQNKISEIQAEIEDACTIASRQEAPAELVSKIHSVRQRIRRDFRV